MSFTGDMLYANEQTPLLDPENEIFSPKNALFGQSMEVGPSCLGEGSVCRFLRRLWLTITGKSECKGERVTEKRQDVVMSLLFCEAMMKLRRSHEKNLQELGEDGVKKKMWDFVYGGSDSDWLTESEWTDDPQHLESVREASTSTAISSSRNLASDDPGSFYDFSDDYDDDDKNGSHSMEEFFSPQARSPPRKSVESTDTSSENQRTITGPTSFYD